MSKQINVDFVTRQIEVDTDGKEHFISAAMAAKDANAAAVNAQNAANLAEEWAEAAKSGALPSGSITTEKIADESVTYSKIKSNTILKPLDYYQGTTDTEKLQNAINSSNCVLLTRDISIDNISFSKHDFYILGTGHIIYLNGIINSSKINGKGYYFDSCIFDGSNGGNFSFDYNFLVTRFTNCCFYNFTQDIFTGSAMQSIYFTNCYFNDNAAWIINATRLDAVIFNNCNVENGNINFMKCNIGYNVVVRDTIIEGLSGVAFDMKNISDCIFEGLYMESNHENFVIEQDACGNAKFDSIHCNFNDEENKVLVRLTEGDRAGMYGTFTFINCSCDNQGCFVRVNSQGWYTKRLSFINNRGVTKNVIWDNEVRNGNIQSNSIMQEHISISGVYSSNGTNIALANLDLNSYGHKYLGAIITNVENNDHSSIIYDGNCYIAKIVNDMNLILNGDGTNNYHYNITLLYC